MCFFFLPTTGDASSKAESSSEIIEFDATSSLTDDKLSDFIELRYWIESLEPALLNFHFFLGAD